jgi:uncharacterized protein YbcI
MKIHIFNLKGRLHKTDEPPTKRLCLDDEGEQMVKKTRQQSLDIPWQDLRSTDFLSLRR